MRKLSILLAFLLIFVLPAKSQTPVALTPVPHMQFLDVNGKPLAGGKVCTFNAGTTTPAATYVDINGVILNSNPIVLDSGGFATIYLANQEYKIILYDGTGNNACPNTGVQQWAQDFVSAFQAVTGTPSILFAGVTSDPTGSAGLMDYRSDIPCFRGFTTTWDCFVMLNLTQTVTNKTFDIALNTLTTSTPGFRAGDYPRLNGLKYVDSPLLMNDAIVVYQASGANPPVLNKIAEFAGALTAPATTDVAGFVGICVQNCTIGSSNAQVQSMGVAPCIFDGATTVNDYVVNSTTVTGGTCHDTGIAPPANPPTGVQIVGRVLSNNAVAGTYNIELFPPEFRIPTPSASTVITLNKQDTQGSATTGTGSAQVVYTYTMPGTSLANGKCLNITFYLQKVSGTNNLTPNLTFGATTLTSGGQSSTINQVWELTGKVCNNASSGTAQWAGVHEINGTQIFAGATAPTENAAGNIVITGTATVAAPDTWKGIGWVVVTDP